MSIEYQINNFTSTWPITIANNDNEEHRIRPMTRGSKRSRARPKTQKLEFIALLLVVQHLNIQLDYMFGKFSCCAFAKSTSWNSPSLNGDQTLL